jgi:DNA-binding PadR family transcriptional regulator
MPRPNRTRFTILGALTLRPMSGYDIRKFIQGSIANFWRESYGQLYPTLRELTDDGLVSRREETREGKPGRYVYSITPRGQETLRAWLAEPAEWEVPRSELLLKIFFGTEVPLETSLNHVARRKEALKADQERLSAIAATLERERPTAPGLPFWLLTIRQGWLVNEALIDWCNEAENVLRGIRAPSAETANADRAQKADERAPL